MTRSINTATASGLDIPNNLDTELIQELNMDIQSLKLTINNLIKTTKPDHLQ